MILILGYLKQNNVPFCFKSPTFVETLTYTFPLAIAREENFLKRV